MAVEPFLGQIQVSVPRRPRLVEHIPGARGRRWHTGEEDGHIRVQRPVPVVRGAELELEPYAHVELRQEPTETMPIRVSSDVYIMPYVHYTV